MRRQCAPSAHRAVMVGPSLRAVKRHATLIYPEPADLTVYRAGPIIWLTNAHSLCAYRTAGWGQEPMKAAVLTSLGHPLEVRDCPKPRPGPREVLVRTVACGICATDLHIADGWAYTPRLPHILGHEPAGVVEEAGQGASRFHPGDRVVPNIFLNCGTCPSCRRGHATVCQRMGGIIGVLTPGAFAEYFTVPETNLFHLPDAIPFGEGAVIADAVVTAVRAVLRRSSLRAGEWALVYGVGGVGQSVLQIARGIGAHAVAVDIDDEALSVARALGAEAAVNAQSAEVVLSVREALGHDLPCAAFDCVGTAASVHTSLALLAPGGELVIVGYTDETFTLSPRQLAQNELLVCGSRSGTVDDTRDAIRLVASGTVRPHISATVPLQDINAGFDLLRSGRARGRVVVTIGEANSV